MLQNLYCNVPEIIYFDQALLKAQCFGTLNAAVDVPNLPLSTLPAASGFEGSQGCLPQSSELLPCPDL